MKKITPGFLKTLFLIVVVGFVSGALGSIAAWSILLGYQNGLSVSNNPNILIERNAAQNTAESLALVIAEKVDSARVDFFVDGASGVGGRYFSRDAFANGIVLTSDGWIIGPRSVIERAHLQNLRVGIGLSIYIPEEIVEDTETGMVFLRLPARNLHAATFGKSNAVWNGGALTLVTDEYAFQNVVVSRTETPLYAQSDEISTAYVMDKEISDKDYGSVIVDGNGAVIGIVGSDKQIILSDHLTSVIDSLFAEGRLLRPTLGVRGIHLSGVRNEVGTRERGFLITRDRVRGLPAVISGSSAANVGLKDGDILIRINDEVINGGLQLSELLLAWKAHDKVDLRVVRGGEEIIIPVELGVRESGKVILK